VGSRKHQRTGLGNSTAWNLLPSLLPSPSAVVGVPSAFDSISQPPHPASSDLRSLSPASPGFLFGPSRGDASFQPPPPLRLSCPNDFVGRRVRRLLPGGSVPQPSRGCFRAVLAGWCLKVLRARSCVRLVGRMDFGQAFDARVGAGVNSAFF